MTFGAPRVSVVLSIAIWLTQMQPGVCLERTKVQLGQYSYEFDLPDNSGRSSKAQFSGAREEFSNDSVHVFFEQWLLQVEQVWSGSTVRLQIGQNARWHEAEHSHGIYYLQSFARACNGECTLGVTVETVTAGCALDDERCLSKRVAEARAYADVMRKVLDGGLFVEVQRLKE